jgi:iron complex transport system substrate-binding protein
VNVFADLSQLAPQISIEPVLQRDPQVIIAASGDGSDVLAGWRRWSQLTAVRNDHLYTVPGDVLVRHAPRILDGAERVCGILEKVREGGR